MSIRLSVTSLIVVAVVSGSLFAEADLPEPIAYLLEKAAEQAVIPRGVKNLIYPSMTEPLDQGELGTLDSFKVVQIISKTEMLADVHWVQARKYRAVGPGGKEFYQVDKVTEKGVWIDGYPTDGMVDDHSYEFEQPAVFEVAGTKSYATAIGAKRTVLRLVPFDVSKHAELFVKAAKERGKISAKAEADTAVAASKASEDKLFRMWQDSTGKFSVEARFINFRDNKVTLEKRDGSLIRVPAATLRKEDQEFFRAELKKRRNKE